MAETVYILAGSNLGDRERNLNQAQTRLEAMEGLEITAVSSIYISDAQGMSEPAAPGFMNQVLKGDYRFTPNELLQSLEAIERHLGRTDKGRRLSRPIDLDILLFGDQVIATERLSIPHRSLLERPFAMVPLLQIVPDLVQPVTGLPIADFLTDSGRQQVVLYKDYVARSLGA